MKISVVILLALGLHIPELLAQKTVCLSDTKQAG